MYNEQNPNVILERMLEKLTSGTDTREGTFAWDALNPVALELAKFYFLLDGVGEYRFINTAYGEHLTLRGEELGIYRKQGTKAKGIVKLVNGGTKNINIPTGTIVYNINRDEYKTTESIVLETESFVSVEAVDVGEKYNVDKNEIVGIRINANISLVDNNTPIIGGTDVENDIELRQRISDRLTMPPRSGCISDYVRWAQEIEGIEYCIVKPTWNGPGTVKLILGGASGADLTVEKVEEVKTKIDNLAPIGATVTYVKTQPLTVNFIITGLVVESGYDRSSVEKSINKSLNEFVVNHIPGRTLKIFEAVSVIINTEGVSDITSIRINNSELNVPVEDDKKATMGTVEYR